MNHCDTLVCPGSPLDASQHGAMDHGTPDGARPTMRNLESQTTIPFGHVNEDDVDGILAAKYDQPLWRCLFENNPEKEVEVDSLVPPTSLLVIGWSPVGRKVMLKHLTLL